jgi:hypothetical protein
VQVKGRPEQVPLTGVHPLDPVPPLVYAHHGLLGELVGLGGAPGEEVESPRQANVFGVEELLEARGGHRGDAGERLRRGHRCGFHRVSGFHHVAP